jgi:hypothetical protein
MVFLGEKLNEKETLRNEFKEFCLKNNVYNYYSHEELEQIVITGKLFTNFNTIIHDNIKHYFLCYIPRYASAFSNCDDIKEGILTIGINDYGEVTGIPYIGDFDEKTLQVYLENTFKLIRAENNSRKWKQEYLKHIKYEVIPIEIKSPSLHLCDMSMDIYNTMKMQQDTYDEQYRLYLTLRDKWITTFMEYACSINEMLDKRREEVIEFVRKNAAKPDPIIKFLNSKLPINYNDLTDRRDNTDDYIYWIFQFKDIVIDKYLLEKPKPPLYPRMCNAPYALVTHLSDMRLKFIRNNKDLRYYMIRIHFSGNIPKSKPLEYYHPVKHMWQSRNRIWSPYIGPCCM